jgi:D-lactate dehydrogenase
MPTWCGRRARVIVPFLSFISSIEGRGRHFSKRRRESDTMKIAFYEASPSDQSYLRAALDKEHQAIFCPETLSDENAALAADADVLSTFIYSKVNKHVARAIPNLKCVATRSTGFDHVDLAFCRSAGIAVQNVPRYGENTVAEHTFALILALSRNFHRLYTKMMMASEEISRTGMIGFDLNGKTLGVVGAGKIGLHVIRIAKGFGMNVIVYSRSKDDFLSDLLAFKYVSFDELLAKSDIITLHVPLTEHTRHLINKNTIEKIKPGAILINTARGGVVSNEALAIALDRKILAGAGLDAMESEELVQQEIDPGSTEKFTGLGTGLGLIYRDNVVFTPHVGYYSVEALRRILDVTVANIHAFAEGKILNPVFREPR